LLPVTLVVGVGIQVLNSLGKWYIARTEVKPAYQLVAGAVGLLIYLYLLNQLILIGAALAATSTRGTFRDMAAGPPAVTAAAGPGTDPGTGPRNDAKDDTKDETTSGTATGSEPDDT